MNALGTTLIASAAAVSALAGPAADDAAKMGASAMNPGKRLGYVGRENGGSFKVIIYGNSIALHGPKADIGWTNNWGMAASAPEKDFAHLVVAGLEERRGSRADFRIRNLAGLERNYTADLTAVPELAEDVAWGPDYVVIAIGENVATIGAAEAPASEGGNRSSAKRCAAGDIRLHCRSGGPCGLWHHHQRL